MINFKARALRDLESIHELIARDDPRAAKGVIQRIQQSIGRLAILPWSGRPGPGPGTRLLVVPGLPYVAVYRVRDGDVDIIAVLHTARRRRS